jgi:hypothetical protein
MEDQHVPSQEKHRCLTREDILAIMSNNKKEEKSQECVVDENFANTAEGLGT